MKPKWMKAVVLFPLLLFALLLLLALYFGAAGPFLDDVVKSQAADAAIRGIGIGTGVAFLILGVPSCVLGVICGIIGIRWAVRSRDSGADISRSEREETAGAGWRKWLLLSVIELLLGALLLLPCAMLFLGAFSGQI